MFYANKYQIFIGCLFSLLSIAHSVSAQNNSVAPDTFHASQFDLNAKPIEGGINMWQSKVDPTNANQGNFQPGNYQSNINQNQVNLNPGTAITGNPDNLAIGCQNWLKQYHSESLSLIAAQAPGSIIVTGTNWYYCEHTEGVLNLFAIPHTSIKANKLEQYLSNQTKVVVLSGVSPLSDGVFNKKRRQVLRDFVNCGGYLITTDRSGCRLTQKMFPEYVRYRLAVNFTTDTFKSTNFNAYHEIANLDIEPANVDSKLLRGCPAYSEMKNGMACIEPGSTVDTVLLTSQWQSTLDSHNNIAALTFNYGKGKVLCLVGCLEPASTSPLVSPLVGHLAPIPFCLPVSRAPRPGLRPIEHAPKQIGAAQFTAINFIIQKLQQDSQTFSMNQSEQQDYSPGTRSCNP